MNRIVVLLAAVLVLAAIPAIAQDDPVSSDVEFLGSFGDLPFSEAVRVGKILYLSGQIGLDPVTGKLPEGGIQPETRQTLTNIKTVVEKYGSSMDQV
ncbi:MAG TPA: Rid family hydrolase, partial [Rhodothermales bacterium]|nr:Rid family hydrolase [Rhodothermales bacterium]